MYRLFSSRRLATKHTWPAGIAWSAVDYIHAPVIPEVLRSKVSVFVELFQKTAQVRRQSESLHRRATQFEKLGRASIAINSAIAIEQMLQRVTDSARDIIDSHQCLALFIGETASVNRRRAIRSASSFSDQHAKWRDRDIDLDALASTVIAQVSSAVRSSARWSCASIRIGRPYESWRSLLHTTDFWPPR